MALSHLPACAGSFFLDLAHWLDKRSAARVPVLLLGILLASGRRTVTSWFRAADLWEEWRQGYVTACACGRNVEYMAITAVQHVKPVLDRKRLLLGIDDTPTARYGPFVEGCGTHYNPTPGPAGKKHVYGHVWVIVSALAPHPDWGVLALPLQAQLYIRACDIDKLPPERKRGFPATSASVASLIPCPMDGPRIRPSSIRSACSVRTTRWSRRRGTAPRIGRVGRRRRPWRWSRRRGCTCPERSAW